MIIYIDADACPVKEEIYRVARRYEIKVFVVANSTMRVPQEAGIELVVVKGGFDAADDWIVARATQGDIAITTDIPLAARCLANGVRVIGPRGSNSAKRTLATRLRLADCWKCSAIPATTWADRHPSTMPTAAAFFRSSTT